MLLMLWKELQNYFSITSLISFNANILKYFSGIAMMLLIVSTPSNANKALINNSFTTSIFEVSKLMV